MAQTDMALATFQAAHVLLNAELDHIPVGVTKGEKSRACYGQQAPAMDAFVAESQRLKTVFTAGHACDGNSPDECWAPVFDRVDAALASSTRDAQVLRAALAACRTGRP